MTAILASRMIHNHYNHCKASVKLSTAITKLYLQGALCRMHFYDKKPNLNRGECNYEILQGTMPSDQVMSLDTFLVCLMFQCPAAFLFACLEC